MTIVIALSGIFLSLWAAKRSDQQLREDLVLHVQVVAQSIDQEDVKALTFTLHDRGNPAFLRLGNWMKSIAPVVGCRSLYSMIQQGDRIIFGPENLQEKDVFASPPGTIYENPPPKLSTVFRTRRAISVGPYTDEYGTFVSAFAPVVDAHTGNVILVIGMDIEANDWKWKVISDAAVPISLTVFLILLLMFYLKLRNAHMVLSEHERSLHESEEKYRSLFETMSQGVVYLTPDGSVTDANTAAQRILGLTFDQLRNKRLTDDIWNAVHEDGTPYSGETHPIMIALRSGRPVFASVMGIMDQTQGTHRWFEVDAIPQFQPGEDKPFRVCLTLDDITERRNAELATKEAKAHLADIIEFLPDATLVINREGKVIAWNKAMESMTGVRALDMIGKGNHEYSLPFYNERRPILIDLVLLPLDDLERTYYHIERKGDLLIGETDVPVLRGEKRFLSGWAHPIYDTSGQIIGAIECIRDITEKHRVEEALKESESRYRLLAENASDIIFTMDTQLRFTYISPSVTRIRGWSVEEAMAQTPAEALAPNSLDLAMKTFNDVLEIYRRGEQHLPQDITLELEETCKGGSTLWTETTFTPLKDHEGRFIGFLGMTRDITERKRSQEEIREREERLDLIFTATNDGIWDWDIRSGNAVFSPSYYRMLGYEPYEFAQNYETWRSLVHPDDIESVEQRITESIASEEGKYAIELRMKKKTGGWCWVLARGKVVERDDGGRPVRAVGTHTDITERKHAEQALVESEERFRLLFENAIEGVFQTSLDGRILIANKSMAKILGYDNPHELISAITDIGSQIYANPHEREIMISLLEKDGEVADHEILFKRADQEQVKVLLNLRLVRDKDGRHSYIEGSCIDITARWRAEEAQKASERKYRTIFEDAHVGIYQSTPDGRYLTVNPAFARMFGYGSVDEMTAGVSAIAEQIYVYPDDRRRLVDLLEHNDHVEEYEAQVYRKDGQKIWILVSAHAVRDDHGKMIYFEGTCLDITGRKKAEEALKESMQALSEIIDFLPDATFVIDRKGTVIFWNRAMEEMTGIGSDSMIGRGDYEYALPFYGIRRPILIDLVFEREEVIREAYYNVRKFGDVLLAESLVPVKGMDDRYLSGKARPLYDSQGNVVGAIEAIRDLTELKRSEELILTSHKKFEAIFQASPDPMAITEVDSGLILDANMAFTQWSGYTREDIVGQSTVNLHFWENVGDRERIIRDIKAGRPVDKQEVRLRTKAGEVRDVIFSAKTIEIQGRSYLLTHAHDITERKRAEEEKKRLESQLAQAQKMESLGTLAGGIAHDFNNILSAIIGYSELALEDISEPEKAISEVREVIRAADRAKDLVRQILTFSRKAEINHEPLSLSTYVKESLKMLRSIIPATIEIRQDIAASGLVLSHPSQINQIIMNLCTNAAQAMDKTGGILDVGLSKTVIGEAWSGLEDLEPGDYFQLTVRDNGHGMPAEVVERIFEPYFTTKGAGEGTGLGLPVVLGM